jgi:hypothetical protein
MNKMATTKQIANENRQDIERERLKVIIDDGDAKLYDFKYTAKYMDEHGWCGDYKSLAYDLPGFKDKTIEECLSFFKTLKNGSINDVSQNFEIGPRMEGINRVYVSGVKYHNVNEGLKAELSFDEYLKIGCPDKIHIDRHITSADSLEQKAREGGRE